MAQLPILGMCCISTFLGQLKSFQSTEGKRLHGIPRSKTRREQVLVTLSLPSRHYNTLSILVLVTRNRTTDQTPLNWTKAQHRLGHRAFSSLCILPLSSPPLPYIITLFTNISSSLEYILVAFASRCALESEGAPYTARSSSLLAATTFAAF